MAVAAAFFGKFVAIDSFAAPISNVQQFLRGLESFVSASLEAISAKTGARLHILVLLGSAFLSAASQLSLITVERDSDNERVFFNDQLSAVTPHNLLQYSQSKIRATVCKYILRLQAAKLTPQQVENIEEGRGERIRCYHAESILKAAVGACDHKSSFQNGWGLLSSEFPALFEFAGGAASVF